MRERERKRDNGKSNVKILNKFKINEDNAFLMSEDFRCAFNETGFTYTVHRRGKGNGEKYKRGERILPVYKFSISMIERKKREAI